VGLGRFLLEVKAGCATAASWFETRGFANAPHHEGLAERHPEERALARVSKDEAAALSNAFATPKEK
jgi:hypothetical protein